jgi:dienelactone hydrolase
MLRTALAAFALILACATPVVASPFNYDASRPVVAKFGPPQAKGNGVVVRTMEFRSTTGNLVTGVIVTGKANKPQPGVLWVHWLGEKNADHTEFLPDAIALARRGATSISVDALWSKRGWFGGTGRSAEKDYRDTVNQVIDLRRALDLLLKQPNVDRNRIAFVGHDFGGMVGALLSAVDRRPQYYVFMAVTPKFSDWYLLGKPAHPQRAAYIARIGELNTLQHLWRSNAKAYLFQFSGPDKYVSAAEATAFFESAPKRRGVFYYDADHSLMTPSAFNDRMNWLIEELW